MNTNEYQAAPEREGLTLDALIETLQRYRQTLPGETPIGYDLDGYTAVLVREVRAVGLMDDDPEWVPGLAIVPLGDLPECPAARIALMLSDESLMDDQHEEQP